MQITVYHLLALHLMRNALLAKELHELGSPKVGEDATGLICLTRASYALY